MVGYYAKIRGNPRKYAYKLYLKYLYLAFKIFIFSISKVFLQFLKIFWEY